MTARVEQQSGPVFGVGKIVLDRAASFLQEQDLPRDVQTLDTDKYSKSNRDFQEIKDNLIDRGVTFHTTVGGNIANYSHVGKELRGHNKLIVARTWVGSDGFKELIHKDLNQPGIKPDIIQYDGTDGNVGETPQSIVIPRMTDKGMDRTIISNQPAGLQSEFASGIPEDTTYAIVNSLGGENWEQSLSEGVKALKEKGIPYAYIPGSAQLDAIERREDTEKIASVYEAIGGAKTLNVDVSELKKLLLGIPDKNILPANDITQLLDQGIEELGAENLFITNGADGSFGATNDGRRVWVGPVKVAKEVNTTGAGDAHMAASVHIFMETAAESEDGVGDIVKSLQWGNASGANAVEKHGAHEDPATPQRIERRLESDPPRVIELRRTLPKQQDLYVA